MSEFDIVMSERSDFELYEIIYYKEGSYRQEALDAAKKEFDARAISSEKIAQFEQKIQKANQLKLEKEKEKTELKNKAISYSKFLIPTEKDTLPKTILSLCIFLSISYIYYLFNDIRMIIAFFEDIANWDLSYIEYLFPYILFPIGIYGLWKSKKYGWYLIVGLQTYLAFSTIYSGIISYKYSMGSTDGLSAILDTLFPRPTILSIILLFVVLFGIVYFLNRIKVLEIFKIKRTNGLLFVLVVFAITSILWWSLI
ncbi:hypothetical protein [uncultured Dokdonia sp.]|uniref:hypothetical protein n=1 Tax=uncultured Dokdonia sp. TaxID=575653 RepID=UPI0026216ADE|nr:hypothetical protein [uncultured Dokdonia sp.]